MWIAHPYATVINAESIGKNFSCIHCTTLGAKCEDRPIIGDNVSLGANVTIIGKVHIGNNVTIGAGSVVVKDIPDNNGQTISLQNSVVIGLNHSYSITFNGSFSLNGKTFLK